VRFAFLVPKAGRMLEAYGLQQMAAAMLATYGTSASDINAMARLGASGHSPQHCQENLLNLPQFKNIKVPKPSSVKAQVIKQKGSITTVEEELVYFFKPSDWLKCLQEQGLVEQVLGGDPSSFWRQVRPNDPKLKGIHDKGKPGWDKRKAMLFHGDAAPHQKHDSVDSYSMKSLLAPGDEGTHLYYLLLIALPMGCRCTAKKCGDFKLVFKEDTLDTIGKELAKDLNMLYDKKELVLWVAPADCEHLAKDYGLPNYGCNDKPCMRCDGDKGSLPISDFSAGAKWKCVMHTPEELILRPLTNHWLLTVKGVTHYTFVYDPMHCQDIGSSSHVVANVLFDVFYKELKGNNAKKLAELNNLVREAYDSARVEANKRVNWVDLKHFVKDKDAPHQDYPDLQHSAIKARQTRYMVPMAYQLCKRFHRPDDEYRERRFYCLKHLNESYEIVDRHRLFMPAGDHKKYAKHIDKFLELYTSLSVMAAETTGKIGKYQWSCPPKFHFIEHIKDDAYFLAPKAFWCYGGESKVGFISTIAAACLSGMPAWRVSQTLCNKYRISKHMQFLEMHWE
jgi:hypothetical protein